MAGSRRFQRNRARVVITFEVEVADAYLHTLPSYKRDAMSVLRELFSGEQPSLGELVSRLRRQSTRYTIIDEKVEVAS